jgi:benzoate/toluate 1,2-dioxygenase beta subunit
MKNQHEVEQFLYRQAELLDSKKWREWVDLFTDDGIYWMPPDASYKTWDGQPAIFAEDKNLMNVRMGRVLQLRRDDVRHFAGSYTHHLKKSKSGYKIKLQRVDMTNAQAAYDYVLQVWV